jgi:hypothetical protein
MSATTSEKYAVVSCHVERLLDDGVWARYRQLVERRPGGFVIASLVRPPDLEAGESEERWRERAGMLRELGPFGLHTHWTAPGHARPTAGCDTGGQVRREGEWLREVGMRPTLFCGGGWYTDGAVAEAVAALEYVDCTATREAPPYLDASSARAAFDEPGRIVLPSGARLTAIPTTRSLGMLGRALVRRGGLVEPVVHVYFHDTDLVARRRRLALVAALRVLGRRRTAARLDDLARELEPFLPEVAWREVARGSAQ